MRVFTGEKAHLKELDETTGYDILTKAFKNHVMKAEFKNLRSYYRESDPEYGKNLFRISSTDCDVGYYSCVYRRNDSPYVSKEKLIVEPSGQHFIGVPEEDYMTLASGQDDLILMRHD